MSRIQRSPDRFVGLDVHKHYLIAVAVDADRNEVLGPRRVPLERLDAWVRKTLTPQDAVVLEMTTNAYQLYDDLLPHVHSVTVVHPPHVALITRAPVMTDKIAARTLAKLHAVGLLPCIWIPPSEVRDHRALVNGPRWCASLPRPRTACTPSCIAIMCFPQRACCSIPPCASGG
jgi:transposase